MILRHALEQHERATVSSGGQPLLPCYSKCLLLEHETDPCYRSLFVTLLMKLVAKRPSVERLLYADGNAASGPTLLSSRR